MKEFKVKITSAFNRDGKNLSMVVFEIDLLDSAFQNELQNSFLSESSARESYFSQEMFRIKDSSE